MLRRELGIWRRLDHVNVVPFLGIAYGFGMRDAMSLVSLWMPNESLQHFLVKHDDVLGLAHRLRFVRPERLTHPRPLTLHDSCWILPMGCSTVGRCYHYQGWKK